MEVQLFAMKFIEGLKKCFVSCVAKTDYIVSALHVVLRTCCMVCHDNNRVSIFLKNKILICLKLFSLNEKTCTWHMHTLFFEY